MIWIPIIFMCAAGQCGFMQGNSTYTEDGCMEQIRHAYTVLEQDPKVEVYEGACMSVQPI